MGLTIDIYIAKRGKLCFTLARFSIILILITFFLCASSKALILKPQPPELAALQVVTATRWGIHSLYPQSGLGFRIRQCRTRLRFFPIDYRNCDR